MVALLQLLLPDVATQNRVAVPVYPIGEVLAGHANTGTFPTLKLSLFDKTPFLHDHPLAVHVYYSSRSVLGKLDGFVGSGVAPYPAALITPPNKATDSHLR